MERLLALVVPSLASEASDGSTLRRSVALHEALLQICPFSDAPRPGLFVMPVRGPSRFFGGEEAVVAAVRACVRDIIDDDGTVGIADGLFLAEHCARAEVIVAPGESTAYRRALPLRALGHRGLTQSGPRLGLHTVGAFADLAPARVLERFDARVVTLHRLARGESAEGPGQRDLKWHRRLTRARDGEPAPDEQLGFFGQRGASDERAERAARRVSHRLGPEGVCVARLREAHAVEDRAILEPFGAPAPRPAASAPWPGRLPSPAPVATLSRPVALTLSDERGGTVVVDRRGELVGRPATVRLGNQNESVSFFAGPWPSVERWWESGRRRAHAQCVTGRGTALLLTFESGRWWLVGVYD